MKLVLILLEAGTIVRNLFGTDSQDLNACQMMLRAVVTFLIALVLIRIAGIRSFGSRSAFDIVLSITVGAVLSRCISGKYSYWACVSAATVLAFMHRLFAMISMYSPRLGRLIKGKPDVLFRDNTIHWEKMKHHNLSLEDLEQAAHKRGFPTIFDAGEAIFETDGKISVLPKEYRNQNPGEKERM